MSKKIIFSAGGTGGHIFPAINLMKHYFKKGYKVLLVTDKRGDSFLKDNPEFASYILKVDTPWDKAIIWWPKQMPKTGIFVFIKSPTNFIVSFKGLGSPGPLDINIPSGLQLIISSKEEFILKTLT